MKTIKKILLALFVVLTAAGISEAKPVSFGIKAGLNVNKLKFNKDIAKTDNSCGWTAGVMADFNIPIVGLGCDVSLMYARMNNSSDVRFPITTNPEVNGGEVLIPGDDNVFGKNFLEIPINIKYSFSLPVVSNFMKPYIFTGPNFAFRLGKNVKNDIANIESRACQVAWNVGLGIQLINHVQIGASYAFGINNVVKNITDEIQTVKVKAKNNYWTVTAAYVF